VFVVAMIILFANPFTQQVMQLATAAQYFKHRQDKSEGGCGVAAPPFYSSTSIPLQVRLRLRMMRMTSTPRMVMQSPTPKKR
jgi:hypothetical protein